MDYEFEVTIDEPIMIGNDTVIRVTELFWEAKVKIGIEGPLHVMREEIKKQQKKPTF